MPIDPRTRGSLPPNPAVKGSDFQAAMNNVFVALVDLGRRLSDLEGQRTVINNASITTGMVQTGAITTSSLAAGSVTAAQIQVGNVVASIMTVGAVNASHIDSASVRASVLDATVLTATNAYITSLRASILDAGVLTAASAQIGSLRAAIIDSTQIVTQGLQVQVLNAVNAAITSLASFNVTSGTITADLIRTAATGARVEIGSTAGGIKGYNSSGVMTFGFDTTTGTATVGAIAVTGANGTQVPASTLTGFVGGGNLLLDSSFESTDPALPAGLWTTNGVTIARSTAQSFHGTTSLRVLYASGTAAQAYSQIVSQHGVPLTSVIGRPLVASAWVYITGTDNTTPTTNISLSLEGNLGVIASAPIANIAKNTWTRVIIKGTPAAGTTSLAVSIRNPYTSGNNTVYYDGVQLEFGDAATAYSPKADEIIYASITATQIAASSIDATRLNVGTLSAISGNLGTIIAGTITGATFQTAASGARVQIDASNGFQYIDSTGATTVQLSTTTAGLILSTSTLTTPPTERRIRWMAGATKTADITANNTGGSPNLMLNAYQALSTDTVATALQASDSSGSVKAYVNATYDGTVGQAWAQAGAFGRKLIDDAGASDFVATSTGNTKPHKIGAAGEPAFQNGWANQAGDEPVHFWKVGNVVSIRGVATGISSTGTTAFTLPAGYTPAAAFGRACPYWSGTNYILGDINITSAGAVRLFSNTDTAATRDFWYIQVDFRTDV